MTGPLQGCKVLIVEDEFLVASLLQEMLETAGCIVAGPIPRIAEAVDAADRDTYDAAILDINVAGVRIDPVADALSRRSVPFVFVTGYSTRALPAEYADRPRLCKPFSIADLLGTLASLVRNRSPNLA
jgi:DNA-binding response OmpR family regulator